MLSKCLFIRRKNCLHVILFEFYVLVKVKLPYFFRFFPHDLFYTICWEQLKATKIPFIGITFFLTFRIGKVSIAYYIPCLLHRILNTFCVCCCCIIQIISLSLIDVTIYSFKSQHYFSLCFHSYHNNCM